MGRSAILSIKILTDASKATKGLDEASGKVGKFQQGIGKAAAPAALAIGAVVAFGKAAADSASRTEQAMGALDSVFGASAAQVKKWSETSSTAVGLSKSEYGELASVIGAQLKNMGVPLDQIAGKTNDLVTMGADLAATFGGTTADAVSALGSALRGETDPIEKYGISIKQADIAARMAADGTAGLEGEAGEAAKTAALLALATDQAGGAMGQFARESDSAAGSSQVAAAPWEDAKSALGTALLPAMTALAGVLATVAKLIKENTTVFYVIVGAIVAMSAAILVLNAVTAIQTALTTAFGAAAVAAWAAALWPILLVIAAIAAVVAIILWAWKNVDWFRNGVLAAWGAIKAATSAVASFLRSAWAAVWAFLSAALRPFIAVVQLGFRLIAAVARVVGDVVKQIWRAVFWAIQAASIVVRNAITAAFRAVSGPVTAVANTVKRIWTTVFSALRSAASSIGSALSGPFKVVESAVRRVIGAVESLIGWLNRIKVPKISLPKLPGLNTTTAITPAGPGVATTAGRLATPSSRASTSSAGVTIVINGAIDPEATARQIRRILNAHGRRMGLTGAGLSTGVV